MSIDPLSEPTAGATMNSARGAAPAPPAPTGRPACPGLTRAGLPCRATPTSDGRCPNHSPKFTAEDRSNWGKRGALSNIRKQTVVKVQDAALALPEPAPEVFPDAPSYATEASVRAYLERCSAKVEAGRLAPSQASAIAQFAALALKLGELQLARDTLDAEIEAQERGHDPRLPRVSLVR